MSKVRTCLATAESLKNIANLRAARGVHTVRQRIEGLVSNTDTSPSILCLKRLSVHPTQAHYDEI